MTGHTVAIACAWCAMWIAREAQWPELFAAALACSIVWNGWQIIYRT